MVLWMRSVDDDVTWQMDDDVTRPMHDDVGEVSGR